MPDAVLWDCDHPYLYTVTAMVQRRNEAYDMVSARAGVRSFSCDPDKNSFSCVIQFSCAAGSGLITLINGISAHTTKRSSYFGWYGGKMEDNGPWLDAFHEKHPDICLGVSEYGCEGIVNIIAVLLGEAVHCHQPLVVASCHAALISRRAAKVDCEGIITYHGPKPACKDYSEEYQALYHEHMAKGDAANQNLIRDAPKADARVIIILQNQLL